MGLTSFFTPELLSSDSTKKITIKNHVADFRASCMSVPICLRMSVEVPMWSKITMTHVNSRNF